MKKKIVEHHCRAIVVSCMDFRLREYLRDWTKKKLKSEGFDRVAIAGGVKNLPFILTQVELSYKLHHIREIYLINHEDCGAYGIKGTYNKHKQDLLLAKETIQKKIPRVKIYLFYLTLDGKFVKVQ